MSTADSLTHPRPDRPQGRLPCPATKGLTRFVRALAALAVAAVLAPTIASAQSASVTRANWALHDQYTNDALRDFVYSSSVQPNWINDTDSLWYRWENAEGVRYNLLLPKNRTKRPLFDHQRMAEQLSQALRKPQEAHRLPIEDLEFEEDGHTITFEADSTRFSYDLNTGALEELPEEEDEEDEEREFRTFSPDSTLFAFARDHNLFVVDVASGDTIQLSEDGEEDYSFGSRGGGFGDDDDDEEEEGEERDGRVRARVNWSEDSQAFYATRSDQREVSELYLVDVLNDPRPRLRSYKYAMPGEENVSQTELWVYRHEGHTFEQLPVFKWKDQRLMDIHWTGEDSDNLRLVRRDRLQRNLELLDVDLDTKEIEILITESVEDAHLERRGLEYVEEGGDIIWWSERTGWGHFYLYDHDGNFKNALTSGPWRAERIMELDSIGRVAYIEGVGREEGQNPYYGHLYRVNLDGSGFTLLNPEAGDHSVSVSPSFRFVLDNYSTIDTPTKSVLRDNRGEILMELEEMDISKLVEAGWQAPEPFVVKAADGVTDIYGNLWRPFDFDPEKKYPIIAHVYPGPQTESVTYSFRPTAGEVALAQLGFIVIQIGNRGGSPQRSNAYHSYGYYNLRDYGLADKKAGIEQLAARYRWIDAERVGIYGHSGGGFMTAAALLQEPYNDFFDVGVSSAGNHDNNVYNQNWSEQHHGLRLKFFRKNEAVTQSTDSADDDAAPGQGGEQEVRGRRGGGGQQARRNGGSNEVTDRELLKELHRRYREEGTTELEKEYDIRFDIQVPANHELAENLKGKLLLVHGDMDNNVHPAGTIRLVNALIEAEKRFDLMMLPGRAHGFGPMSDYFDLMLKEYFTEHLLGEYYDASADITDHGQGNGRNGNGGGGL